MPFIEDLYHYEKLKWELIERYKALDLDEIFDGEVKLNDFGEHYRIEKEIPLKDNFTGETRRDLTTYLQLVRGIGEKRHKKLRKEGIENFEDLAGLGKYQTDANKILKEIENVEYTNLYERINKNFPRTHECYLSFLRTIDIEDILLFDIETGGLRDKTVFLIGTATFQDDAVKIEQSLAREKDEEQSILKHFEKRAKEKDFLLSFNGRRFDMTVIKKRKKRHGMDFSLNKPHIDLLHISKSKWRNRLKDFKLSTIEKEIMDAERKKDLPSSLIPHFYKIFLKKGNIGPLVPVMEHNERDILSMARLLQFL